ncbi:NHL repeat-containing protein [Treponema parvum]|uniref:NHL repeat-containing protein n=1 Tax=Treponema parvum TaxID=138851 RepID=UPI00211E1F22|nr:NHL repeat-containing protein [Treponema parvum]
MRDWYFMKKKFDGLGFCRDSLIIKITFFTALLFFAGSKGVFSQTDFGRNSSANTYAETEFRRGVQAYYRNAFNDAILQFEKALSYLPEENLILDWLGKAYYRSGIEGAALQQWQFAAEAGYGGLLLQNRIEIVRERRITGANQESSLKYTEAGGFPGVNGKETVFSQPVSVLPNPDGSIWVLSYGSNDLLRIDVNGNVINRVTGPINGFDRPTDIIRLLDGKLLISESAGGRLSLFTANGRFEKYIGSKGRSLGQMVGPQYLAQDGYGNIYVTDFGNCRVNVFDRDGEPLFFFGSRTTSFPGFSGPTGIAVDDGRVFVADCVSGAIYEFDRFGNYVDLLVEEKTFSKPESMKKWGSYLVVCDKNRIISVDTRNGSVFENANTGNAPSRITSAVPDINGNILVTDITANEVYLMSKMTEVLGGLFVQIEHVNAEEFPKVKMDVRVENRRRQPVVGLRDMNFYVSENKRPVTDLRLEGAVSANTVADITFVIDRDPAMAASSGELQTAVREIVSAMEGKGTVRVVSAGKIPVLEYRGNTRGLLNFSPAALKAHLESEGRLDLALRLAANDLMFGEKKRAIIYITCGNVSSSAFGNYGLSNLTAYLNNNSIAFSVINLKEGSLDGEIQYLCDNTAGEPYYVYRPEGLLSVVTDIINLPSGLYQLSFRSSLPTNFGRAFLPVEAEIYLMNRSGRDESGYFAPLQ